MSKTKIPWATHSINPVKGLCPVDCKDNQGKPYCYARRMYQRFKLNPEIRFEPEVLDNIRRELYRTQGYKIFVGSTFELFGDWVDENWLNNILAFCNKFPQHTFIFLTKQPQNLPKEWPDNCWVGVSTPNASDAVKANEFMGNVRASVKFLSIEPMLDWNLFPRTIEGIIHSYNWLIIGAQTPVSKNTKPRDGQVLDILFAARATQKPVFIKPPLSDIMNLRRQEFPK